MQFIDLSTTLRNDGPNDPPQQRARIYYADHAEGRDNMLSFFPKATEADLPEGLGWAYETAVLGTHTGTHLDAPWHYHPTMNRGDRAITIDEVPLEWCYGNGVKLDFSKKGDGYLITAKDIETELKTICHTLKPGEIVLIQSGAAPYEGTEEYMRRGCGMGREATVYLAEKGIRMMGTDAWSWDRPLPLIAEEFQESGDNSIIWEGHFAGIACTFCHMEKLTNLDLLPGDGFKVICFPIKIARASAGWVRPVALIENSEDDRFIR